jgi:hypothetical protein
MKRKEFLKSTCALGMCTCAGMSIFSNSNIFAQTNTVPKDGSDWKIGFTQKRFAKFLEIVGSSLDKNELNLMFEKLGHECAKENKDFFIKFKDNVDGFLEEMKKEWIEDAIYNKDDGSILLIGKKTGYCFCPLVDRSLISKEFCNCSVGYTMEVFKTVTGKSVKVEIEKSVLRGGESCNVLIKTA